MTTEAPPRRRRRWLAWILVPLVALVLLAAVAVVLVETVGRGIAEEYVAGEVEESLPAGVTGEVEVELRGPFLIGQYLSGRMQDVRLASDDLRVGDVPAQARLRLEGAPVDLAQPIETAAGTVDLDDRAVEALLAQRGLLGDVTLGDGVLQYADTASVLGADLDYTITASPALSGGVLTLAPESAEVTGGPVDLDATRLLELVVPDGISLCVAEVLPDSVVLDGLEVEGGTARIHFSGEGVVLSQEALARTGSC